MKNKLVNKSKLLRLASLISGTSAVVLYSLLLQPNAQAQNIQELVGGNRFLREIEQLKGEVNSKVQGLTKDLNRSWSKLSGEMQSQINSKIQSQIDDLVGDLHLPDLIKTGDQVKEAISNIKVDISQIDARIQGQNARSDWYQKYTIKQAEGVVGIVGQQIRKQENDISQAAADISLDKAQEAQSDYITQEVMKKIATQNAHSATILKLVQSSLQEQNQLTATTNVNLSQISESLLLERQRRQQEEQGAINAIYQSASFNDQLWNRSGQ
jgi:hypothetical protein